MLKSLTVLVALVAFSTLAACGSPSHDASLALSPLGKPIPTNSPPPPDEGEQLVVTPARGRVGATVILEGRKCYGGTHPTTALVFGSNSGTTGTEGAFFIGELQHDSEGHFRMSFKIPAELDTIQGEGGGPVKPGTYNFYSKPPACVTLFTVTE